MSRVIGWLLATVAATLLMLGSAAAGDDPNIALPVPRTTIYPGETIDGDSLADMLFVARTVARGTVFESRDAIAGKVARRTLLPGKPVPINAVRDPYAVNQGKPAQLVFKSEGLTITGVGIALQNGSVGDVISARNIDSGITVKGTVQADGTLRVDGQ
ncbi:MAG TPA: flagellar basal body P-ring formation chaperone FlgA [Hyphomicrobiaceae bacterium]|nr:flagellar basal body P-ring formation chaperone FlgA [Hyphomicrobiaceae bacterium]